MSLMRIYPALTQDGEFTKLGELGFSGSLNDRQKASLVALGYSGALPDMMYQFWLSGGVYPEGDPIPGGTISPVSISVQEGVSFSQQFTASGGVPPYSWSVQVGSLPSGLSLVGDTVTGTPTGLEGDVYLFTLRATDSNGDFVDQEFSGTVQPSTPLISSLFSIDTFTTDSQPRTVNNGIDLVGEGGMVWFKSRTNSSDHLVFDTEREAGDYLSTNLSSGESASSQSLTSFNSDGFSLGTDNIVDNVGDAVTWTFRQAPQFFDVVTYTGDGISGRTVTHNLGSVPGMIWIKRLDSRDWNVYHRAVDATAPEDFRLVLNDNSARSNNATVFNDTAPTSTNFTLGTEIDVNASGSDYVAYLFAHEPTGNIQCGSYTGTGSFEDNSIDLGWEPQFVLIKSAESIRDWQLWDNQRTESTLPARLLPNTTNPEQGLGIFEFTPTGFRLTSGTSDTNSTGIRYIYAAIKAP